MSIEESKTQVLTVKGVREALGIGYNQAYKLVKDGKIRSFRIGTTLKIPAWCLEEYIHNELSNGEIHNNLRSQNESLVKNKGQ